MNKDLEKLINIDDYTYGLYTFLFENLNDKITNVQKHEYIIKSIECGKEYALKYKDKSIYDLLEENNLKVKEEIEEGEYRNLFGLFTYPNQITLFTTNIYRVYKKLNNNGLDISEEKIKEVVLAHEFFHYLENKDHKNFYTKVEKITTFKLFKLNIKSNVIALSEIAAMNFAKNFCSLDFSTYIFDYYLLESIDFKKSKSMLDTLTTLRSDYDETNNI